MMFRLLRAHAPARPVGPGSGVKTLSSRAAAQQSVDKVFALFEQTGACDYIGEPISQAEHSLQAADLASKAGFGSEAILAALLHDCGHMLGIQDPNATQMGDCGIADHENLGGKWLQTIGFSEKVSTLVARHVDAKRYLCSVNPKYHAQLSPASRTTLGYQGGPMTPDEATAFEKSELFKTIIAMRRWDEAAKVPNKRVPPLEAYRAMMEENVIQSQAGRLKQSE